MHGKLFRRGVLGFAPVLFWLLLTHAAALAQSPAEKLEALIKNSGYTSSKVSDNVWTIDFTGKQLAKFRVILSASGKDKDGIVVVFANPVEKSRLPSTANLLTLLLKANHDFDFVKVGIDGDGDVFVRADIPDSVEGGYFKNIVEQVAAATDQLYGRMKPLLRN
jgi:putative sensory transduction regulator